jgi:agmatine deiminase
MTRVPPAAIPPAEWAPQRRIFTAFPSDGGLWEGDLAPAQAEVAALVRQLAATVPVTVLANGDGLSAARAAVGDVAAVADVAFGDIWLRDTAPIFRAAADAAWFRFNGWGGKYDLPGDDMVGAQVAGLAGAAVERFDLVLEGGAIDGDGAGLVLTTEQCLLNPNRNPGMDRRDMEAALGDALGCRRVVWLGEGLAHDHTDGHVDNLARFVGAGTVALPVAAGPDDPNAAVFADAAARVRAAGLAVAEVPSVGRYAPDGELVPASHMNWVVANGQVVVPLYGGPSDADAVRAVKRLFPRARVTGLRAGHILTGGGSFHCITQQQPEDQ